MEEISNSQIIAIRQKTKWDKKKLLMFGIPTVAVLGLVIAVSIYLATVHITGTVNEPIQVKIGDAQYQTLNQNLNFDTQVVSVFPHQSITLTTFSVKNIADVDEKVYIALVGDNTDWVVTASDGFHIDGSGDSITPGEHTITLTAVYNGETAGSVFNADLKIGGTLQQ